MSKFVKIFAVLFLLALVVAIAAIFFLKSWVSEQLTPDGLVRHIESSLNCRAEIAGVKGSLSGGDTTLAVTGLVLAPRDGAADNAMPLAERSPIPEGLRAVFAESVSIDVAGGDLVSGKLNIRSVLLSGLDLQIDLHPEGGNSLAPLFTTPATVDGKPNPDATTTAALRQDYSMRYVVDSPEAESDEDDAIYASDIPLPSMLGRLAIEAGTATLRHVKTGAQTRLTNLNIDLTDIQVDAKNLAGRNHLDFHFDTTVLLEAMEGGDGIVQVMLAGGGEMVPFDINTGRLDPSAAAEVRILRGSRFDGLPIFGKLGESLEKAAEYGIEVLDVDAEKVLLEDTSARAEFAAGRLTVLDDLGLSMDGYEVGFAQGAWFDFGEDAHDVRGGVVASEELTEKAKSEVRDYLSEKAGATVAMLAESVIIQPMLNDDGRVHVPFKSTGSIDDPEVGVDNIFGGIGGAIQGMLGGGNEQGGGGGGLGGLLKGLLGGEE